MNFNIITLFPEMFEVLALGGVVARALQNNLIQLQTHNPRDFCTDIHRTVDDKPYGGGDGMVMKVEPLRAAINAAKATAPGSKVIYLTPDGKPLKQNDINQLAAENSLIVVAGRYEGIDERVREQDIDAEYSIGDYVLSGGELPAMVLIDAIARQIPGVVGKKSSVLLDSFMKNMLDYPHYTRPEVVDGQSVPQVLLGGDHQAIEKWRKDQALRRTQARRPDLLTDKLNHGESDEPSSKN